MGYRRTLLGRWSVRDRLAVLVMGLTVAFLVGSVLLVFAAGGQATAIAAEFESPGSATAYPPHATARKRAPETALVLPVATVRLPNGSTTTAVGVPPDPQRRFGDREVALRPSHGLPTLGDLDEAEQLRLAGREATVTVVVHPRDGGESLFAPAWVVTDTETVRHLGPTGAVVLSADEPTPGRHQSTALRGALGFFLAGTRQALGLVRVVVAGGAVLVGVTAFSVTRMSVCDRITTIRMVRSTGGPPSVVLALFAGRALGLTAVGVALGYALGVILPRVAVNLAVTVGLPTSLTLRVTPAAVRVLVPTLVGLLAVGAGAGLAAAWPAARKPPARLSGAAAGSPTRGSNTPGSGTPDSGTPDSSTARTGSWGTKSTRPIRSATSRLRAAASPTLLGWRPLVPSVATLTAFVLVGALVAAAAGVAAPLATADGATATSPESTHPVSSQVPAAYADALRRQGIDASAEILLFAVIDGRPVPARGADYGAFASVTPARIVRGSPPGAADEAVVGADVARSLGLGPGDRLTLGGSTRTALDQVAVVGVFAAPGPFDDQVIVSLDTARHLSTVGPGRANVIRADSLPDPREPNGTVGVVDVDVPGPVVADGEFPVRVTVRNDARSERTATVAASFRRQSRTVRVTVPPTSRRTATVRLATGPPGTTELRVGGVTRSVRVVDADALALVSVPGRAPPESEPRIRVVNATGHPVSGATVDVTVTEAESGSDSDIGTDATSGAGSDSRSPDGNTSNSTVETNGNGFARIPLDGPGTYALRASRGNRSVRETVAVRRGVARQPTAELDVSPARPSLATRPTARITFVNPWNRTVNRTGTVETPGGPHTRRLVLAPGERTTVRVRPARRPPGEYEVRVHSAGETLATTTYRVTGDERIVSALASGGRSGTTAIGRAIEVAFGNLGLVLVGLGALAGLMTVGATTATFAQAVQARSQTVGIRRATGADPLTVLRLVLADAVRVGVVATAVALGLALVALRGLEAAGALAVFGVGLSPTPSPAVLAGSAVGALGLTILGAGLAAVGLLVRPPAALLAGRRAERRTDAGPPRGGSDD